ncbi:hypothetical protein [Hymenobacter negativus]|uniref:Uncharacterized protein n=1 Tax=Hymenobacter negativus TaxID=2795026 RepID=A0ABS3QIE7_9BACT|nr:hypothetical protein [Hymenobacter negativus]MBO2011012.1 hypothetical protein [Hymenobacter negativus]
MALVLLLGLSTLHFFDASAQPFSTPAHFRKANKKHPIITIDTTFLFESYIDSYTFSDQIMERKGLLLYKPVSLNSYKSFYCVFRLDPNQNTKYKQLEQEAFNNSEAKKSVVKLNLDLELGVADSIPIKSNIDLQPYCGTRYVPHRLKLDLLYLGKIPHRVPLFLDCKGYDRYLKNHHNRNYRIQKLRTFLITKYY